MKKFVIVKNNNNNGKVTSASTSTSSSSSSPPTKQSSQSTKAISSDAPTNANNSDVNRQKQNGPKPAPYVPTQVKMSGYLKKKRNKMGGWRKLWFVLHNQLLLSYSSKNDYEKKLAPFKDVVNLVPGTIIRPTNGPRFIIETSTNLILTYRCDDSKTCSEWITALVESLSLGAQISLENKIKNNKNKFHFSLDNLPPDTNNKKPLQISRSWDSIYRYRMPTPRSPNLPMILSTASILKRNGLHLNYNCDINNKMKNERVRNFRLHQNDLKTNQSCDVHRINSMFSTQTATTSSSAITRNNNKSRLVETTTVSNIHFDGYSVPPKKKIFIMNTKITLPPMNNNSGTNQYQSSQNMHNNYNLDENTVGEDGTGENNNFRFENSGSIESQIQNMTIEDDSLYSTIFNNDRNETEIIKHGTDDSKIIESPANDKGTNSTNEPIYAVVDLKNKYERRAKRSESSDKQPTIRNLDKERPRSFNIGSCEYEEIKQLSSNLKLSSEDEDEENIYEPINIPELLPKGPMWRYFSKINIEALVEITKWKKEKQQSTLNDQRSAEDVSTTTFSDMRKRWGHHRKSIKNRMKKFYAKDTNASLANNNNLSFSDDDLGSQAASCSTTSDSSTRSSEKKSYSFVMNEIGKYRKGEKHIFGSLGRLRKSRTSLCLDDLGGVQKSSSKNLTSFAITDENLDFQKELKKEVNRRYFSDKKIAS